MTNEVTTGGTDLYAQLACRIRNALGEFDDRDKDLETLIRDLARVRTRDDGLRANYEALVIRLGEVTEKLEAANREKRGEREKFNRAVKVLSGIYAVIYPRIFDVNGKRYAFHSPIIHEQMQAFSVRIRAIPDEIAAMHDSAREGGK